MLKVENLKLGYDNVPVIFDVSLEVHEKEVVSIVGSNGAGKSTILRGLSGVIKPMAGTDHIHGRDHQPRPAHRWWRWGGPTVPEGRQLFRKALRAENLCGRYVLG